MIFGRDTVYATSCACLIFFLFGDEQDRVCLCASLYPFFYFTNKNCFVDIVKDTNPEPKNIVIHYLLQ